MTPEAKIIRDLAAGQTTADSLAPRVGLRTEAAEIILRRLITDGKVSSRPLAGKMENIPVYFLTPTPN